MRVLMLSKACVVGAYQRKLEEIAALGVDLTVVVPPQWIDERGVMPLERTYTHGYTLLETPILFNGNFHLHFYPAFGQLLKQLQPDLVHLDEEPYNFATWHAQLLTRQAKCKFLFFSWQNLLRHYPPPFRWMEADVLRHASAAIVGNAAAASVWQAKGYTGAVHLIPQFGVDPEIFQPALKTQQDFTIGYAGRLVPEKGVDLLLLALAQLPNARLHIAGTGPEKRLLDYLIDHHQLQDRVHFESVRSNAMPQFYAQLDCFVLPSRTRPNWKEQFGRVLIEAMACGVPVVGAESGEIPNVIGDGGLTFPEDDLAALVTQLRHLQADAALRATLAEKGRARVLAQYTQKHIAAQTVAVYHRVSNKD